MRRRFIIYALTVGLGTGYLAGQSEAASAVSQCIETSDRALQAVRSYRKALDALVPPPPAEAPPLPETEDR